MTTGVSLHFSHAGNSREVCAEAPPVLYKIIHMAARPEHGSHAVTGPYIRLFMGLGWGMMKPNQVMPIDRHSPQLSFAHTILLKCRKESPPLLTAI